MSSFENDQTLAERLSNRLSPLQIIWRKYVMGNVAQIALVPIETSFAVVGTMGAVKESCNLRSKCVRSVHKWKRLRSVSANSVKSWLAIGSNGTEKPL